MSEQLLNRLIQSDDGLENHWREIVIAQNNFFAMFKPDKAFRYDSHPKEFWNESVLQPKEIGAYENYSNININDYVQIFDEVANNVFSDKPEILKELQSMGTSDLLLVDMDTRQRLVEVYQRMNDLGFTYTFLKA